MTAAPQSLQLVEATHNRLQVNVNEIRRKLGQLSISPCDHAADGYFKGASLFLGGSGQICNMQTSNVSRRERDVSVYDFSNCHTSVVLFCVILTCLSNSFALACSFVCAFSYAATIITRGSAIAEEPRDALRQLKYYGRFLTELLTRALLIQRNHASTMSVEIV